MEEAMAPYLLERPASAGYKQAKFSNKSNSFKFKPIANVAPANSAHGGLLHPPPRFLSASFHSHQYYPFIQLQQVQPPLLPSPSQPLQRAHRSLPSQARTQSLNPRKWKSTKREQDLKSAVDRQASDYLIKAWKNRLSNHKSDLAEDAFRVSSVSSTSRPNNKVVTVGEFDQLPDSLFTLSPPPSSLPLPKFSLRPPKLKCNVEAAGVDTGATDDLRRLLRLP